MTAIVLRGDARQLPLPDGCVDLIVTSPPYFGLRSYTDGGQHYAGQIGSEPTPQAYLEALWACTAEWARVLKPGGSMFINLGDKYAGSQQQSHGRQSTISSADYWQWTKAQGQPKSLLGLPWRYAIGATDRLGLILRAEIIWAKPNGLPESVTDRVRRAHEQVLHFTRQPRYYAAVDEIREPTDPGASNFVGNPLGKLPGSVWPIPSAPLTVPPALGVDHFAAFPPALVRPLVLGWSPPGVCAGCGEGRRPVTIAERESYDGPFRSGSVSPSHWSADNSRHQAHRVYRSVHTITGYACACTPYTDHPGTGNSGERYGDEVMDGRRVSFPETPGPPSRLGTRPKAGGGREYHFDVWTPPPTRPALVLDPFAGTGTTVLVASAHGRIGFGVDRSMDYARLARWRVNDPGERARALDVPKPPKQSDGQEALFEVDYG